MDLKGKVALVTGANGFVGYHVSKRLLKEGMKVRAIVRRPEAAEMLDVLGIEAVVGDVNDAGAVKEAVAGAALVVHCVATANPDLAESRRINVEPTQKLLDAAIAAGAERFIHISTGSVYAINGRPVVDESCPLATEGNAYSVSKAEADLAVFAACEQGLKATILRPVAILGTHPTSTWGCKVPKAIASGQFKLAAGGIGSYSYVHIDSLAEAVVLAARNDASAGEAYNVVDGHTTWKDYTDHFRTGDLPEVPADQAPPGLLWTGQFSGEKIVRVLGYRPVSSYEAAMAETKAYIGG